MAAEHDEPSETSPLLASRADVLTSGVGVDCVQVDGDVANGHANGANGHANGTAKPGDDEESQEDNGAGPQSHQGMPEVRKQLKSILPAVAIGVRH